MIFTKKTLWFTLVELIVVTTILVILTSVGFYSYVGNLEDSRDSVRKSDIAQLNSALILYKQKRWIFPLPWESINILNDSLWVALQWKMNESVPLNTLDSLLFDPKLKTPYSYSITSNKQEFQLAWTLENGDNPRAILAGNYSSVSVNILPTIMLATDGGGDLEIRDGVWGGANNRTFFVFNGGSHNLVYDFINKSAQSDGTDFSSLLNDPLIEYWQNSDYRSCTEILEAWKSIGDWEYQILDDNGTLSWVTCSWM